jgi:ABC-2 type transport system ATP-binding protein
MSAIVLDEVSRWYGNVVAVNDVTMTIGPGITGLLGPNGAGKSTLISLMSGFLPPSAGSVTLDGAQIWRNEDIYRSIGLVPESEAVYEVLTGARFVRANAELHGMPDADRAAHEAIRTVELTDVADRRISTYSKGMRQRIKMAAALVHRPQVLLLDEPFNGMDPRQRLHLMDLLREMGAGGRTVLFSSHILEEVQQLAHHIEVVVAGRHAASGDYRAIRQLMTDRPHLYRVTSADNRRLAAVLIADPSTSAVEVDTTRQVESLAVQVTDFERFSRLLPRATSDLGIRLHDVAPVDESLESVFAYLVAGGSR